MPQRLQAVLQDWQDRPYKLGKDDCLAFAAAVEIAVAGTENLKAYLGSYKTLAGAKKAMKKIDCESVGDVAALHFDEVPPSFARVGDLIEYIQDDVGHLAVCLGPSFRGTGENGMIDLSLDAAKRGFLVG